MFPSWNARAVGMSMAAREAVELAARAGFDGVDLMVRDLVDEGTDPHTLRRLMVDLGVRGGAWPLPVHWRGDLDRYQDDLTRLPRYAEAAAVLGLTRTGTWVLPEVVPAGTKTDEARRATFLLHRERLGGIARVLEAHGIRLGLEIMGPATARTGRNEFFVRSYAELEPLLGALRREHENVGVLADAFHLFAAGEPVPAGALSGAGAVVWVHVADATHADLIRLRDEERALPGETGFGESRALLQQLQFQGYDGPVTAEPLHRSPALRDLPPLDVARRTREALASVWPGPTAQTPASRSSP